MPKRVHRLQTGRNVVDYHKPITAPRHMYQSTKSLTGTLASRFTHEITQALWHCQGIKNKKHLPLNDVGRQLLWFSGCRSLTDSTNCWRTGHETFEHKHSNYNITQHWHAKCSLQTISEARLSSYNDENNLNVKVNQKQVFLTIQIHLAEFQAPEAQNQRHCICIYHFSTVSRWNEYENACTEMPEWSLFFYEL